MTTMMMTLINNEDEGGREGTRETSRRDNKNTSTTKKPSQYRTRIFIGRKEVGKRGGVKRSRGERIEG